MRMSRTKVGVLRRKKVLTAPVEEPVVVRPVVRTPAASKLPGLGQWSREIEQRVANGRSLLAAANEVASQMWRSAGEAGD